MHPLVHQLYTHFIILSLSLFLQPYTERQAKHWWRVISVNHMIQISPSCGETYMNIRVTVLDNFPYGFLKFQRNFKSGPGKRIVPLSNLNSPGIYLGRVFHFRFSLVGLFFFFFFFPFSIWHNGQNPQRWPR